LPTTRSATPYTRFACSRNTTSAVSGAAVRGPPGHGPRGGPGGVGE
jgi:hypothetical protein